MAYFLKYFFCFLIFLQIHRINGAPETIIEELKDWLQEKADKISNVATKLDSDEERLFELKSTFESMEKRLDAIENLLELPGLVPFSKTNNNYNKWNWLDKSPYLNISGNGLTVGHNKRIPKPLPPNFLYRHDSVRSFWPVPRIHRQAANESSPNIASYFEVQILNQRTESYYVDLTIGYCDQSFPLEQYRLENYQNTIAFGDKTGMWIDQNSIRVAFESDKPFSFKNGDIIGVGIAHFPENSTLTCFATCNGKLLGSAELPENFAGLQLFPVASLSKSVRSIRTNFGGDKWHYNPQQFIY